MRTAADKICKYYSFTPAKIIEVHSLPTALSLVSAGQGIIFICKSAMAGVSISSPAIYFSLGNIQHITDIRAIYKLSNPTLYLSVFCQMAKTRLLSVL